MFLRDCAGLRESLGGVGARCAGGASGRTAAHLSGKNTQQGPVVGLVLTSSVVLDAYPHENHKAKRACILKTSR